MLVGTYNPSMYVLKVEIHLHSILFALLYCLSKGLENTSLLRFIDERHKLSHRGQAMSEIYYSDSYWQKLA